MTSRVDAEGTVLFRFLVSPVGNPRESGINKSVGRAAPGNTRTEMHNSRSF